MEKIKRNVYEALPEYTKFLKMCTVCERAGISSPMLNQKLYKKKYHRFLQKDVDSLNAAIDKIVNELKRQYIKYDLERDEIIKQLKGISEFIKMVYIVNSLGKTIRWYKVRIESVTGTRKGSCFSKDEIDSINLELLKIVSELERTELVLVSEE